MGQIKNIKLHIVTDIKSKNREVHPPKVVTMSSPGSGSEYFQKLPYKQDIAPAGGYKKIVTGRNIPVRIPLSGVKLGLAVGAVTALGWYNVYYGLKQVRVMKRERTIAELSITPLLQAEKDREYLRKMVADLEEEALIMADVPGWVVGESTYHDKEGWKAPPPNNLLLGPSPPTPRMKAVMHWLGVE